MATITINGHSIEPIRKPIPLPPSPSNDSQSNYILIQTNPSLTDGRRAELAGLGVTILEYLPRYSYLCRYEHEDLKPIQDLSYIAWAEDYSTDFKLERNLSEGNDVKEVDVVFHDNVDPTNLRQAVAAAAHLDPEKLNLGRRKARLTVKPEYLSALAAIDEVRHIEAVRAAEPLNNVAREILGVTAGNGNGGSPFEGEGQIVAVADSGFDLGSRDDVHQAFKVGQNGERRVLKLYALGRPGIADDPTGHGTHVAGSILGDGESQKFGKVRGTAPKAGLFLQSLLGDDNKLKLPTDLHDLFLEPYSDGARIHNNTWGSDTGDSTYTQQSLEVDDFIWHHRDFVVCIAAGNEGRDHSGTGTVDLGSITAPGTAKNCITVGATESVRPKIDQPEINLTEFARTYGEFSPRFPADPIRSDRMADDPESIAAFSSRGPASDQRCKPDLVAPGTFILSTRSRALDATVALWAPGDGQFVFLGGTSMASPLVAGCVALAREYLDQVHNIKSPSASLVKALLINGARPFNGQNGNGTGLPDWEQGFGRVNMLTTVGPFPEHARVIVKDEATALVDKQTEPTSIIIAPQTSLLKVTLVWTDPPGPSLQNDLDLIVRTTAGEERHGNQPPGSPGFDRANNVEQVIWNDIPAGDVEIVVRAERIAKVENPQTYALVIRTA
ncbi:MAG: serine protease AprX [Blastocatellia bacterium]|nr:serine protease AprX [Blastocatellia bacterium]